ncbi:MAG: DUF4179 domain-containing protein [Coriobacteriales bacterium]
MRKRYREELRAIDMGAERREELAELLAAELAAAGALGEDAPKENRPRRRKSRPAKVALILAACLMLGLGTAFAASTQLAPSDVIDALFHGAPHQTIVADSIGRPVDASASSNGVTVRVEAIAGDESSYSIVYSVGWEGEMPKQAGDPEWRIYLEGGVSVAGIDAAGGGGGFYSFDSDPGDNSVCYVEQHKLRSPAELKGRVCRASFKRIVGLYIGEGEAAGAEAMITLAEGSWNLRFVIDYEDLGLELCAGEPVEAEGWDGMRLVSANLTPFALQLQFSVERDGGLQFIEVSQRVKRVLGSCELALEDGSALSIDADDCPSNTSGDGERLRCELTVPFEEPVDIASVRSVSVGGVVLFEP